MINILERGISWQIDRGPVDYSLVRNSIVHDVSNRSLSFDNLIPICQDFCRDTRLIFPRVRYLGRSTIGKSKIFQFNNGQYLRISISPFKNNEVYLSIFVDDFMGTNESIGKFV